MGPVLSGSIFSDYDPSKRRGNNIVNNNKNVLPVPNKKGTLRTLIILFLFSTVFVTDWWIIEGSQHVRQEIDKVTKECKLLFILRRYAHCLLKSNVVAHNPIVTHSCCCCSTVCKVWMKRRSKWMNWMREQRECVSEKRYCLKART